MKIILDDTNINTQFVQEYNATIQQELFALPVAPKKVASLQGMDLYSSNSLKKKYINAIYNIAKCKPVAKDIERLVNNGKIVPCWVNKNIFKLAMFKVFAPYAERGIAGFFTPETKQIFILMDNNIKWGFSKDKWLSDLMLHELMHMASDKFKNNFIKIFWNEFMSYYKVLYSEIFKTQGDITKECRVLINFIFNNFEYKKHSSSTLKKYIDLISRNFRNKSTLSENEFNSVLSDFYHFIKLYFTNLNSLFSQIKKFKHIYIGLLKGYEVGLSVTNNMSFCSQELFYPSEVTAMYIELYKGPQTKLFSIIKKL